MWKEMGCLILWYLSIIWQKADIVIADLTCQFSTIRHLEAEIELFSRSNLRRNAKGGTDLCRRWACPLLSWTNAVRSQGEAHRIDSSYTKYVMIATVDFQHCQTRCWKAQIWTKREDRGRIISSITGDGSKRELACEFALYRDFHN
jgi:hypothetical protein